MYNSDFILYSLKKLELKHITDDRSFLLLLISYIRDIIFRYQGTLSISNQRGRI